jgi:hypothetical protein
MNKTYNNSYFDTNETESISTTGRLWESSRRPPFFIRFKIKYIRSIIENGEECGVAPVQLDDPQFHLSTQVNLYDTAAEFIVPILLFPNKYQLPKSIDFIKYIQRNCGRITDLWLPKGKNIQDIRVFAQFDDEVCDKCNIGRGRTKHWMTVDGAESPCGAVCPHQTSLYSHGILNEIATLRHNMIIRHLVFAQR